MRWAIATAMTGALLACGPGLAVKGDPQVVVGQRVTLEVESGPAPAGTFTLTDATGRSYDEENDAQALSFTRPDESSVSFIVPPGTAAGAAQAKMGGDYEIALEVLRLIALSDAETGAVRLYDLARPSSVYAQLSNEGRGPLALSSDGAELVSLRRDQRELHFVDLTSDPPGPAAPALRFDGDGRALAVSGPRTLIGDSDGVVLILRTAARAQVQAGRLALGRVEAIDVSGDLGAVVSSLDRDGDGQPDQRLFTWLDMAGGELTIAGTESLAPPTPGTGSPQLAITRRGAAIVVDGAAGQVLFFDRQSQGDGPLTSPLPAELTLPVAVAPAPTGDRVHVADAAAQSLYTILLEPSPVVSSVMVDLGFVPAALSIDSFGIIYVAGGAAVARVRVDDVEGRVDPLAFGTQNGASALAVQP